MTDFPQPLRLAKGSHQPGSGKGCAMNVVSYTNGDTVITDYPNCSARPLAVLVQMVNDALAGVDGFLSPENSVIALDLGWRTVGTANKDYDMQSIWWQQLTGVKINPEHWDAGSYIVAQHIREKFCGLGHEYDTHGFFMGVFETVMDIHGLIKFANKAIDSWIAHMPVAPAEPITAAQIEYAMERIGS